MTASGRLSDWVGLLGILASLPLLWLAKRLWASTEPARLLTSRVLMGDGMGFLFGGLILSFARQWELAAAALIAGLLVGAVAGVVAMRNASGRSNTP
jgi:hypothetical protein